MAGLDWMQALENRLVHVGKSREDRQGIRGASWYECLALGAVENELFLVEREITALMQVLEAAKDRELHLRVVRRRHFNQQCTLHRLPDELVSMIFEEGNPRSAAASPSYAHSLAAVCHHWRVIALHSPLLWRHFHFHRYENFEVTSHDEFYTHIHRSKLCKLDLELNIWGEGDEDQIKYIMDTVGPHLAQCYQLQINVDHPSTALAISPLPFAVTALKHFSFGCHSGLELDRDAEDIVVFRVPPTGLESVEVEAHYFTPSLHGFEFGAIKHISFNSSISRDKAMQFFGECTALEVLEWCDLTMDYEPMGTPIITLPSAVILDFEGSIPIAALSNIIAPSLCHLLITSMGDRDENESFSAALAQVDIFPSIRSLGLMAKNATTTPSDWVAFVSAHSQLQVIVLDCQGMVNLDGPISVLWALAQTAPPDSTDHVEPVTRSPLYCPDLRVLALLNFRPKIHPTRAANAIRACLNTRVDCAFQMRITAHEDLDGTLQGVTTEYPRNFALSERKVALHECASLEWPCESSGVFDLTALMASLGDRLP